MLAIEIDGDSHDFKHEYDMKRQGILESFGIKIIRFDDLEVKKDMNNVIRTLEITIEQLMNKS